MTDVNIAVELFCDASNNQFDTALLVSGDSDLAAPLKAIRRRLPDKRVAVAFPPDRFSKELRSVAHAYFTIGRARRSASQLP